MLMGAFRIIFSLPGHERFYVGIHGKEVSCFKFVSRGIIFSSHDFKRNISIFVCRKNVFVAMHKEIL